MRAPHPQAAEGRTLEEMVDELQAVGTELGALEKQRDELGEDGGHGG